MPVFRRESVPAPAEHNPLDRQERAVRRTAWTVVIVCVGAMGGVIVTTWIQSQPSPDAWWGFLPILALPFVAAIVLTVGSARSDLRMIRNVRPIESEVVDARLLGPRGLMVILRDGMVLTTPLTTVVCTLFFAADGRVLHPSVRQFVEWSRWRSARQIGLFGGRRGPPDLRAELEALQGRLATMRPMCRVREWRIRAAHAGSPQWVVDAAFPPTHGPFGFPPMKRVVSELAVITLLIRHALRFAVPELGTIVGA